MITRFAGLSSRLAICLALLFSFTACGGGGGGGGGDGGGFLPDDSSSKSYNLTLELVDEDGESTDTVTSTSPTLLLATVKGGKNPVSNYLVSATTNVGVLLPESGSALTDDDGIATFLIEAGESLGAGVIDVTIETEDGPVTESINYQVGQASLRLGHFDNGVFIEGELDLSATSLPSAGSALISLAVVDDDGERVDTLETVSFSSGCSFNNQASLPATVSTTNGHVIATYTATGCTGSDTITASLGAGNGTATGSVNVAAPTVNSLAFVSATPELIALKGTGGPGRQETSDVVFRVVDGNGSPLAGEEVNFRLSTEAGGLSLSNASTLTNSEGTAVATVQSGNIATPVRVTASIDAESVDGRVVTLSTISDVLVISTGLPDQNSISLSSEFLSIPQAANVDGVTMSVTVHMADKFNNPVPDGTAALFTTEYGSIGSSCTTVGGSCDVTWTSQQPRFPVFNADLVKTISDSDYRCPSHNGNWGPCPDSLGAIHGLRSTILVTAVGEEYFVDENANGVYDQGEPFDNLPEAYVDHNEDGQFTPTLGAGNCPGSTSTERCELAGSEELFTDYNSNGMYDLNDTPEWYNGSLCPVEGNGVWCSRDLINVRDAHAVILASDQQYVVLVNSANRVVSGTDEGKSYTAYIADGHNNRPADGEIVTVTGKDGCAVVSDSSFTVPASNAIGAYAIPVITSGTGFVTISAGSGSTTFSCTEAEVDPLPDCGFSPQPPGC